MSAPAASPHGLVLQVYCGVLQLLNRAVHRPYLADLAHAAFWSVALGLGGPVLAVLVWVVLGLDWLRGLLMEPWPAVVGPPGLLNEAEQQRYGAVLITGCDRGFGRDLALSLARKGWKVYAGCLTEAGVASLAGEAVERLVAVPMDVTDQAQVAAVLQRVRAEHPTTGLHCLVNNAGLGQAYLVDWMDMADLRRVFEVNFFSMVQLVKAALPLLKTNARLGGPWARPRVVTVTSFAALFPAQALFSAYASSKHAADAFTNALAQELRHFNIQVCSVSPTFHQTDMVSASTNSLLRCYDGLGEEVRAEYGPRYRDELAASLDHASRLYRWEPAVAVAALEEAVTAWRCREQYVVGMDGKFVLGPIALLPRRFVNALARHCMPFASFVPAACCTPTTKGQHAQEGDEAHDNHKNKMKKKTQPQQPPAADVVGSRGGAVRDRRRSSSAAQDQQQGGQGQ